MYPVKDIHPGQRQPLQLTENVVLLKRAQFCFERMLDGWDDQHVSLGRTRDAIA